jgi:DNA-binding response OmpR family regulator
MAEKILIVDDDTDSLKLIGLMLQRQGYEITAASSGGQAFNKALAERPNLIILDVMMPDMDGYEICRRLRANPATQPIPIIMFTAKTLIDDKVAGFEAGADDYLTKPTHPAELSSRVKAVLARSAAQKRSAPTAAAANASTGTIVAVVGVKGGVGTTTVACNIAAIFQKKEQTVLADIRPGQGSMAIYLKSARATGMANLLSRAPSDINARTVEAELTAHPSNLKLLTCSTRPREMGLAVNPDTASAILKQLRGISARTVVDLGVGLTPLNVRLMKEADQTVVVTEPTRFSISMAKDMLKEIETMGIGQARANTVVVSRAQSALQVPWAEAEKDLGQLLGAIGHATDLAIEAAEAGFPIVLSQPTSAPAAQLAKLSEQLFVRMRASAN